MANVDCISIANQALPKPVAVANHQKPVASHNHIPLRISIGLSFTALFTALSIIGGITPEPILWSELLLCVAGSICAVLGSVMIASHSKKTRAYMLVILVAASAIVVWSFWTRDFLGWNEDNRFYYDYGGVLRRYYKQLPVAEWTSWRFGVVSIISVLVFALTLSLSKMLIGYVSAKIKSGKFVTRIFLVLLAIALLIARIVQTNLAFEWNITGENYLYWLVPCAAALMFVATLTTFLPRKTIIVATALVVVPMIGLGLEVMFTDPALDLIPGFKTLSVAIGFITTAVWLGSTTPARLANSSSGLWRRRVSWLAVPMPILLFVAGYVWSSQVDTGALANGQTTFAEAITMAKMRRLGVKIETGFSRMSIEVLSNAAPDILLEIIENSNSANAIQIQNCRTDMQFPKFTAATARRIDFWGGEISPEQLVGLLEHCDVTLLNDMEIVGNPEDDFSKQQIKGSLTIREVFLNRSKLSDQIKLLSTVKFNELIFLRRNFSTEWQDGWSTFAVSTLTSLHGKSISLEFEDFEDSDAEIPGQIKPNWEEVSLTFENINLTKRPIRFFESITSPCEKKLEFRHGQIKDFAKLAIASAGLRPWTFRVLQSSEIQFSDLQEYSLLSLVGKSDPDCFLLLVPEWLAELESDQVDPIQNLFIGARCLSLNIAFSSTNRLIQTESLDRFTSLRRLGLGTELADSYGFLSKMPELRELQISGETLPGVVRDLCQNLTTLSKLEKFMRSGMPSETEIQTLTTLENLKEVVLFGIDSSPEDSEEIAALKKQLPGVEIRTHESLDFFLEQPDELKQYRQRLLDEIIADAFKD